MHTQKHVSYVWTYASGGIKHIDILGACCWVFLHPVEYAGEEMDAQQGNKEQPGNFEHWWAEVEHNIVLEHPDQAQPEVITQSVRRGWFLSGQSLSSIRLKRLEKEGKRGDCTEGLG